MKKTDYYEICEQKLKYLNYADNTVRIYLFYLNEFLETTSNIYPSRLISDDFQKYLDNYEFSSISQQNQVINAIRFLYKFGLGIYALWQIYYSYWFLTIHKKIIQIQINESPSG